MQGMGHGGEGLRLHHSETSLKQPSIKGEKYPQLDQFMKANMHLLLLNSKEINLHYRV